MSIELLAPAGGPEPFRAAVAAGADAIYCGVGNDFNARRGARNFTLEDFAACCRLAHLAGTRVYVTINVVVRDDEMGRALSLVRDAYLHGADAFIIQDWGLLAAVRRTWPELEVHVSTQANVHDARGVRWCRELGAGRVTLSRELSLKEIATIAREGVELEVFGHGAICFCYSGVCLLSSLSGGRSANRGLCAQPCRLPYDLVDERGRVISAAGRTRPLCPKDNCTIDDVEGMISAGVGSLKVEGRMKAPDYVYSVVSTYRSRIDEALAGERPGAEERSRQARRLKRAFNRDFTDAYLKGTSGDELMSYERSNNRGQLCGEVVASSGGPLERRDGRGRLHRDPRQDRRSTRCTASVRLTEPVGEGDLLELRPLDDPDSFLTAPVPRDARAGEAIECRVARPMPTGCPARVIRSKAAHEEAASALARDIPRKRQVSVRVVARLGEPFRVEVATADGLMGVAEGFVVEAARTKAVTEEDLAEHVGRMGSTPFEPVAFDVELDEGCGMGFSAVHKVRAEACRRLEEAILNPYESRSLSDVDSSLLGEGTSGSGEFRSERSERGLSEPVTDVPSLGDASEGVEVCALVSTPEVARAALEAGATRLYASSDDLAEGDWPEGVVPVLDEVCREMDHERLDAFVCAGEPVAVGNVSELALAPQRGAQPELRRCIPVHNREALAFLESKGAAGIWLSEELTLAEIQLMAPLATVPVGIVVSGRPRVMTSEHCVLQTADACIHDCPRCQLRWRHNALRDRDGKQLPVRTDVHGRSRIYDAFPLDLTPQTGEFLAAGVSRLMADCTLLEPEDAALSVARLVRQVAAARVGRKPSPRLKGATSGHLFTGIG